MAQSLVDRIRQRNHGAQEAQEDRAHDEALAPPPRARNPFLAATDDLAAQWDAMVVERDSAKDEAERHRGENVHLASEVDRLRKELATRTEFFELEVNRLTARADKAVDENVDRRAKLEIISKALMMVLNETIASAPVKREQERSINTVTHRMTEDGPVQLDPDELRRNARSPRNLSTVQRPVRDFNDTPADGHPISEDDAEAARDLINRLHPVVLKR